MAIDQKGVWESPDVVLWQSAIEDDKDLVVINTYRHKLMEKFVLITSGVESTKINSYRDADQKIRTTFEFVLQKDIDPFTILDNRFERVVGRLLEAVKAERELEKAKRHAANNSFN